MTIKRVSLDLNSRARFEAVLPAGANRLRIAMSVNQAGAGYLAAFSREIRLPQGWVTRRSCDRLLAVAGGAPSGAEAPESNRASRGLHDRADFEDRLGHRARATPPLNVAAGVSVL